MHTHTEQTSVSNPTSHKDCLSLPDTARKNLRQSGVDKNSQGLPGMARDSKGLPGMAIDGQTANKGNRLQQTGADIQRLQTARDGLRL